MRAVALFVLLTLGLAHVAALRLPSFMRRRQVAKAPSISSTGTAATEEARVQQFLAGLPAPTQLVYGNHPAQHIDLHLPEDKHLADANQALPTVFIVHGGFWKNKWTAKNTQTTSLVPFFLERGFAVALTEYRRRDDCLYPGPEDDVVAALQATAAEASVDEARLVVLGHSAGGTLAIAACERAAADSSSKGAKAVNAALCVSIAPVAEMLPAYSERLSDEGDAIERYLGVLPSTPEGQTLYKQASLPIVLSVPTLLVTGTNDVDVPPSLVTSYFRRCAQASQTTQAAQAAGALPVELLELDDAEHYDVVTANAEAWVRIWRHMHQLLHTHIGWAPPPRPCDYGVSAERGFLPTSDPLTTLLPLPPAVTAAAEADGSAALFARWEAVATELPGLLAAQNVRQRVLELPMEPAPAAWTAHLAADERWLERAYLTLSFLAHAAVWGESPPLTTLPPQLAVPWCAVAKQLGRRPVLTYASFNLNNWRRLDLHDDIMLGNTCRCNNFLAGQDEEWFSAVHVAIEARSGAAVVAVTEALRVCAGAAIDARAASTALDAAAQSIDECIAILERMGERCDPYIYNERVRVFMSGWTADSMPPEGLTYEGVPLNAEGDTKWLEAPQRARPPWRQEAYFGETGAQSSVVPALDAALGVGFSEDELLPYLHAMRDYMPPRHSEFIQALERAPALRDKVLSSGDDQLQASYNRCIEGLVRFRKLHFELAYTYVRQWDERPDEEIKGTGGTPFMPYLKKHRRTTFEALVQTPDAASPR